MLKILNAAQIKSCDAFTIAHEPIASIALMERACRAFGSWFTPRFDLTRKIGIVCGTGNNGGDGLGIARLLKDWGYPVKVWIVKGEANETDDFKANLARLTGKLECYHITSASDQGLFFDRNILIDSVFGSGISRAPEGIYAQVISCINQTDAIRISVDVPSGLRLDQHSSGTIVKADYTVSFQIPKLAFLLPENFQYVGEWHLVDIGLSKKFLQETETQYFYLTHPSVKKRIKPRSKFDNKGNHGRALLIAGSYGKMGAAILAARAALRAGTGLLTVHVPQCGYSIVQTGVPEAMVAVDAHEKWFTGFEDVNNFNAIGIGPGIGQDEKTVKAVGKILAQHKPMVIDADALNILAGHSEMLKQIPAGSILTPHPGEFERLVGSWSDDFERLEKLKKLASTTRAVIVLKGAHTSIATPDGKVYFNATGNPGMATGGTGDILTGILTGLLAQGYPAEDSAIVGVYLHGLSGDLAANEKGMQSLIASDLIEYLPFAFKKIGAQTQ